MSGDNRHELSVRELFSNFGQEQQTILTVKKVQF